MTIEKAIADLLINEKFKEDARTDAKVRVYLGRIRKGMLGHGAAIDLLLKYGYKIDVKKPGRR